MYLDLQFHIPTLPVYLDFQFHIPTLPVYQYLDLVPYSYITWDICKHLWFLVSGIFWSETAD